MQKQSIHIFANGGPSHIDTFDPKPKLEEYAGREIPGSLKTERRTGAALPSPFQFQQHGESGLPVSELFPSVARHADRLLVYSINARRRAQSRAIVAPYELW